MESRTATAEPASHKRPRSPSGDFPSTANKVPKTQSNHLQINYLARQYPDNLPLVSTEDNLPNILRLIGEYDGVLQRHESIAGNLGACPLGPILMKRFERLFDGPPRVLKSNNKDGANIGWLDVIEFAKNKPEQFNLEKTRNGVRVCQFYLKQCRVEISEEDYVLIASGMPQKLIPPQPIDEDEEKELGALEILEKNLQQIIQMADSAAARARQLTYRLKNRRTAIISRRESEAALQARQKNSQSPSWHDSGTSSEAGGANGNGYSNPQSPPSGFVAVNSNHRPAAGDGNNDDHHNISSQFMFNNHPNADNITIINGTNVKGASPTTRAELMKKFFTTADRQARGYPPENETTPGHYSRQSSRPRPRGSDGAADYGGGYGGSAGTVAIPNTPSSLLPQPKSSNHYERDDGGPYKMEMVARMEELQRGERILPPCDRCRRLHMDCLKNLTACMGCTKKHAKCSWKDVKEEELREHPPASQRRREQPDDHAPQDGSRSSAAATSTSVPPDGEREAERGGAAGITASTSSNNGGRADSTSSAPVSSVEPHHQQGPHDLPPPRRAASEIQGSAVGSHDRRISINRDQNIDNDDDDPDANSRLMQAIMDTVDHHTRVAAAKDREKERESDLHGERDRKVGRS